MARMLPAIVTLEQHQQRLRDDPEAYRPERCCHCGKGGMHQHGYYERNAPRGEGLTLSLGRLFIPVSIARTATAPVRGCRPLWHRDASMGGRVSRRYWRDCSGGSRFAS